jgi:O-antigen/teichoic acid export membrane protein
MALNHRPIGFSSNSLRVLLLSVGFSLFLRGIAAVVYFIATLLIARLVGPAGSGEIFLAVTLLMLASTVSRLGLGQALTKYVSTGASTNNWTLINYVYRVAMSSVLVFSGLVTLACYYGFDFVVTELLGQPAMADTCRNITLAIAPLSLVWLHAHCFQGIRRIFAYYWFQQLGLSACVIVGLGYALIATGIEITPDVVISIYVVASIALCALALGFWKRSGRTTVGESSLGTRELFSTSLPLYGSAVFGVLLLWLPQLILGSYHPATEVGIFTSALRVASVISMVLVAVNSVTLPKYAAQFYAGDMDGVQNTAVWSVRIMLLVCLPLCAVVIIWSDAIMLIFGEDFIAGTTALTILAVAQCINVATGSVGGILNMTGFERDTLLCIGVSCLLMLAFCFALIPSQGILGAAIAQAGGLCMHVLLLSLATYHRLGFVPINIFRVRGRMAT